MQLAQEMLGALLEPYGYRFAGVHSRPKGVAVEFESERGRLFAVDEEGMIIVDLILSGPEGHWRISLNQALWFGRVREVAKEMPAREKLRLFCTEVEHLAPLLEGDLSALDERFSYPLTRAELQEYLVWQRGS